MTDHNPSVEFAAAILRHLVQHGVRHVVVCPGSRSQALALSAVEFERVGALTLHVRIDERSAGFLALGLAVETGEPTVVITTSGTAVANLHPAVLEAHHSGVPLLLLTADRPEELRGIGANQTTDQLGMFGPAARIARDIEAPHDLSSRLGAVEAGAFDDGYVAELVAEAYSAAVGFSGAPGPVQLNLAFREPLSGPVDAATVFAPVDTSTPHRVPTMPVTPLSPAPNTIVIAGHGAGEQAEDVASRLGAPLIAEVSSGARFGPNLIVAYRELLRDEAFGGRVARAIVFGHPTLSREVPALLERDGIEVIVVRGDSGEDYNPGRRASVVLDAVEVQGEPDTSREARAWLGTWVAASRAALEEREVVLAADGDATELPTSDARTDDRAAVAEFARTQLAAFRTPVTRRMLVASVWQKTWPHDRLVFGASRLIREADGSVPGKKIRVHSNRGLAGIDGTVATATGIALASQSSDNAAAGTTRVVLGDLALLHDVGSLLDGYGEAAPRMQLIVGNDRGGSLFELLEVAETTEPAAFRRVLTTPHEVNLAALAEAYGWDYRLAGNRGELDEALSIGEGRTLIEVPLSR